MRYSLLSLLVATVVLGAMAGVNIRGLRVYENMGLRLAINCYGWPFPFHPRASLAFSSADRRWPVEKRQPVAEIPWDRETGPHFGDGDFKVIPLLIDLVVAFALAVLAGVVCEWLLDRRFRCAFTDCSPAGAGKHPAS